MKSRQSKGSGPKSVRTRRKNLIFNSLAVIALVIPFGLVVLNIYGSAREESRVREIAEALPSASELITPSHVCMATNVFMGPSDQIEVRHGGGTYYACSQHCAKILRENSEDRYALDSVSNNRVDKAKAFVSIHPDRSGRLCYFESKANHIAFIERVDLPK